MPIPNWNMPATLASVYGDLALNANSGDRYLLVDAECDEWQDVRAELQNIPTADGSLIQERFLTGTRLKLVISLWVDEDPACNEDLVRMSDTLAQHAGSMVKAAFSGRFLWTPDGHPTRLIQYMQLTERMTWSQAQRDIRATLLFDSPFPYAIDFTQEDDTTSGSIVLNNTGNTPFYPVFKVTGGGAFTLSNDTTGFAIVYTGSYSGYAEIDTFRNTIYENGNGANLKDGLDVENSDFFSLVPGNNVISISGGTVEILWQAAWL